MALLGSCWFIIEYILLPNGSLKWFCLSFYIHPFCLFFVRIFVFIRWLHVWILYIIVFTYRITCFSLSFVFTRLFGLCLFFISSFTRINTSIAATSTDDQVLTNEKVEYDVQEIKNQSQIVLYDRRFQHVDVGEIVFEVIDVYKVSSVSIHDHVLEEEPNHDHEEDSVVFSSSNCTSISNDDANTDVVSISANYEELDMDFPIASALISSVIDQELIINQQEAEEEVDLFYKNYADKMRWFDVLSHDRTCGINEILNQQHIVSHGSSIDQSIVPLNFSESEHTDSYIGDDGVRKRLLTSFECDLEVVYVAQTCLSWEALHHQYCKVKALVALHTNGVFYDNTAERFQQFHVLLERFMENERGGKAKRYWTYVQRRSSVKSLLQVPPVSGCVEKKVEIKGEAMEAIVVLKAIEKSINAFFLFVKSEEDTHKHWWKIKPQKWTCSQLEDLRDFNLLCDITNLIKKKKLWIKELKGKKTWYKLKGSSVVRGLGECDDQKKELMFVTIEIKMVTRVLKMSMVSTSQLKWCKQKLDSIDFIQGKLVRASLLDGPCLFPSS